MIDLWEKSVEKSKNIQVIICSISHHRAICKQSVATGVFLWGSLFAWASG
jgi:hypothetical protein